MMMISVAVRSVVVATVQRGIEANATSEWPVCHNLMTGTSFRLAYEAGKVHLWEDS
jgi:hypothetical protein